MTEVRAHLGEDIPAVGFSEAALTGDVVEQVLPFVPLHHDVESVLALVPVDDGGGPGDVPDLLQDDDLQLKMVPTLPTVVCSVSPPEEHRHSLRSSYSFPPPLWQPSVRHFS